MASIDDYEEGKILLAFGSVVKLNFGTDSAGLYMEISFIKTGLP